jgi:hypothetical protein
MTAKKHPVDQVRARNISLYAQDWAVIEDVVKKTPNVNNVSAAIRHIVREWALIRATKPREIEAA